MARSFAVLGTTALITFVLAWACVYLIIAHLHHIRYDYGQAVFLVVQTITALGFEEELEPMQTIAGRILFVPLVFSGIPLLLLVFSMYGEALIKLLSAIRRQRADVCAWYANECGCGGCMSHASHHQQELCRINNKKCCLGGGCATWTMQLIGRFIRSASDPNNRLGITIVMCCIAVPLGASVFVFVESLSYLNALYYTCQVITTVGMWEPAMCLFSVLRMTSLFTCYACTMLLMNSVDWLALSVDHHIALSAAYGDITPSSHISRIVTVIYALVGILCFTLFSGSISNYLLHTHRFLQRKLDGKVRLNIVEAGDII